MTKLSLACLAYHDVKSFRLILAETFLLKCVVVHLYRCRTRVQIKASIMKFAVVIYRCLKRVKLHKLYAEIEFAGL